MNEMTYTCAYYNKQIHVTILACLDDPKTDIQSNLTLNRSPGLSPLLWKRSVYSNYPVFKDFFTLFGNCDLDMYCYAYCFGSVLLNSTRHEFYFQ